MTVTSKNIVPSQIVTDAEFSVYFASELTILDRFTVHNSDSAKVELTVWLTSLSAVTATANLIFKGETEKAHNMLLMKVPIIQGTANQLDLKQIGKQTIDTKKIRKGVEALLLKD